MDHFYQIVWPLASVTLAISIIATAFVELLKDLLPIRRHFQRNYLKNWFTGRLAENKKAVTREELIKAETDLIHLATGGDKGAFYDLEPPQLCGQMDSAAQIALAYPDRHPELIRFLAPEADPGDLNLIQSAVKNAPPEGAAVNDLLDARNRVTHHLRRSIDALQIAMGFRWKFCVQVVIYIVCFGCAFISVYAVKSGSYTFWEALAVGIVAGFGSPVISDIAGAINRWRKP